MAEQMKMKQKSLQIVADIAADTNVAFKNCAPFTRCITHINHEDVDADEKIDVIMPMYNLIEY